MEMHEKNTTPLNKVCIPQRHPEIFDQNQTRLSESLILRTLAMTPIHAMISIPQVTKKNNWSLRRRRNSDLTRSTLSLLDDRIRKKKI